MNQITVDFISGFMSGTITGIIVSPFEYLKVFLQDRNKTQFNKINSQFQPVCCIFIFNIKVYNKYIGLMGSAITGSFFLTPADHLLYRKNKTKQNTVQCFNNIKKINYRALFTGFVPMCFRQGIFLNSVIYIGPQIAKKIFEQTQTNQFYKNFIGRMISGFSITIISQPFDYFTRRMQQYTFLKQQNATFIKTFYLIKSNKETFKHLFDGVMPRSVMTVIGGACAGTFFDQFKKFF